jgi:hypothetical protein
MKNKNLIFLTAFILLISIVGINASLNDDILSYWAFDDGSGLTAVDSVGNYNLTLSNGNWYPAILSKINTSLSLGSEHLDTNIYPSGSFSMNFWMRIANLHNGGNIFRKYESSGCSSQNGDIIFDNLNNRSMMLSVYDSVGWNYLSTDILNYTPFVPDTQQPWNMITLTFNGSSFKIYLQGENPYELVVTDFINNSYPIFLFEDTCFNFLQFSISSYLDEMSIWDRELSESEILDMYNYQLQNITYIFPEIADTTLPYFTTIPSNPTIYENESIGVLFQATDETQLDSYYLNDTSIFSINQSGWFENITALTEGIYNTLVYINDSSNNINSTLFVVTVLEIIEEEPEQESQVSSSPIYQVLQGGGSGLAILLSSLAQAMPRLVILLVLVGGIVGIFYIVSNVIKNSLNKK